MDSHNDSVAAISAKIGKFYTRKEAFRIYHGSTNSTRKSQYQLDRMVDTSRLSHVLKVDTEAKTALVEPNVPMDALVEATLQHGLVPPVVMEFPGITVGGGFSGTAGESSSFKYGFFDRTVNWIEMVLANGEIVKTSSTERPDLFFAAASSFGTLGVTTLLELQLVEASTHVELTYYPVRGMSEALQRIEESTADPAVDYLDGIMFSRDSGVICVGHRTNDLRREGNAKFCGFKKPTDPWFYLHAQKLIRRNAFPVTENIPIIDYLFRYDRGGFWVGSYAFKYFLTPFNRITRWLLDSFMHTRVMYHALHKSGLYSQYIIQDVAIPYSRADEFAQYLDLSFKNYPIWLCPLKQSGKSIASTHSLQVDKTKQSMPDMMLNFGVWGPGPKHRDEFVAWNRQFEKKVHDIGGQKWLYAHAYYTEEEFNEIYNREKYDELRTKYHAEYLPTVYDKVKVDVAKEQKAINESWKLWLLAIFWSIWPLGGIYGVLHTIVRSDYLLPRRKRGD